jgi:hypothetical protein
MVQGGVAVYCGFNDTLSVPWLPLTMNSGSCMSKRICLAASKVKPIGL